MAATIMIETKDLTKYVLEDLWNNKVAVNILEDIDGYDGFNKIDLRLLLFLGRVYIPTGICREIFKIYYKSETLGGHQGIEKMLEKISRNFYFP